MANSLEPENDNERAVKDAVMLLLNSSEKVLVSGKHLLTICRTAPDYALSFIDRYRPNLLMVPGTNGEEIASIVREVEWDLCGPSQFIDIHHSWDKADSQFIKEKLDRDPNVFSQQDLNLLIRHSTKFFPEIRIATLAVLSKRIASFAEQIATEPPGMSEDIESLKESIRSYGFNHELNEILQKIDDELQEDSDAFEQVATMRHIRSFFEELHMSVSKELQLQKPSVGNGTPIAKCGQAIDYLERKKVITEKLKNLARCLYSILSDDDYGVHALKASRDYTRLCRNMVVEYAVTLFFELERRLAQPGDS